MNYYNEWDKGAAAWLRELINQKLIPYGYVDERSITEVTPSDLEGFTQCHFFAGIAGWSLALKLAGVSEKVRLWTGSKPCQPFSDAGNHKGKDDERHLAPTFSRLARECNPPIIFGEQVKSAIGHGWLDDIFIEMESQGYACASSVLPACCVGSPHQRDRLFYGAKALHADNKQQLSTTNEERVGNIIWTDNAHVSNAWEKHDTLLRTDGGFMRVEPGYKPVVDGIPGRVGRVRGYGNAIVPQVAAEFIKAFMGSI